MNLSGLCFLFQARQRERVDEFAVLFGGEVQMTFHSHLGGDGIYAAQHLPGGDTIPGL